MHTEEGIWEKSSPSAARIKSRIVWWTLEFHTNVMPLETIIRWHFEFSADDNNSTKGHGTLSNPVALHLSSFDINFCLPVCHSFIHQWHYSPLLDLGRFFSFLILYTAGRISWTGDQPVTSALPTHRTKQTQNKRTHRHPCLELNSNPRSQRSRGRKQFIP
jgi:hypothetical protein